jgi:hypothetical protein
VRAASNRKMVADWRASPWGVGRNSNSGGQKRTEDRGGSVAGEDERWEMEGSV